MTKQKTLVNTQTEKNVEDLINAIENSKRKADCQKALEIMKEITNKSPKIWGKNIIGFGKYKYKRKNGDEFEWFNVGLSPAKAHLSIYVMYDINSEAELLNRLGPHKTGKGCLYIKNLADVDLKVLEKLIEKSDKWQVH